MKVVDEVITDKETSVNHATGKVATIGIAGGSQRPPKKHVSAEALSLESILAREDKPIVFDLTRDKLELNEWFKSYAPSKIRRSDGIGWIMVIFIINI